jgi:hypothetical protein
VKFIVLYQLNNQSETTGECLLPTEKMHCVVQPPYRPSTRTIEHVTHTNFMTYGDEKIFCPPFACLQCKGWAIAMTLSVCLSVCPHKTRNCEETERRTKKVLEIKVVGYHDSYSGVPLFVTSDDL